MFENPQNFFFVFFAPIEAMIRTGLILLATFLRMLSVMLHRRNWTGAKRAFKIFDFVLLSSIRFGGPVIHSSHLSVYC